MSEKPKKFKVWKNTSSEVFSALEINNETDPSKTEKIKHIRTVLNKAEKALSFYDKNCPVSEMAQDDYETVLSSITKALWKFKGAAPVYEDAQFVELSNTSKLDSQDVLISIPSCGIVEIKTPLLYPNQFAGAYLTAQTIENELRKFVQERKILIPSTHKLVLVFERYVSDTFKGVSDNDNYEQRRITNSIANVFGVSDAYDSMFFFYSAKRVEKDERCSKITLLTAEDFAHNTSLFL